MSNSPLVAASLNQRVSRLKSTVLKSKLLKYADSLALAPKTPVHSVGKELGSELLRRTPGSSDGPHGGKHRLRHTMLLALERL